MSADHVQCVLYTMGLVGQLEECRESTVGFEVSSSSSAPLPFNPQQSSTFIVRSDETSSPRCTQVNLHRRRYNARTATRRQLLKLSGSFAAAAEWSRCRHARRTRSRGDRWVQAPADGARSHASYAVAVHVLVELPATSAHVAES